MAVWVALGRAAERAVLFRSGAALERLASVHAVCFDKTGTLTSGDVAISRVAAESLEVHNQMLARAAALASRTNHPLGRAIAGIAESVITTALENDVVAVVAGRGVSARWPDEPGRTRLGSFRYLVTEVGYEIPSTIEPIIDAALANGDPLTLVGWERRVRGVFVFREELRPETRSALAALQAMGIDCRVLTGDHANRGRALEGILHVPVQAELLPDGKVQAVRLLSRSSGATAMVGDGVNDAQAMAVADVGIAMGCGADLTRDNADICLLSNDLSRLPWAIELARATVRTVRRNIWWAFGYNAVGVVLAACGWLHPSVAAVLMVVSSLAVTASSLQLGRVNFERTSGIQDSNGPGDSDCAVRLPDSRAEAVR
jgi:cation transport ATPase